jgi:hypothetical protein
MKKILTFLFILISTTLLSGCWTVKKGQKSGVVIKVSKEGVIWGTYEGEIILGGLENASGASGRTFNFTFGQLKSDLVKKSQYAMENNKHVVINYHCEAFIMPWSGESKCFVDNINILPEK